MLKRFCLLYALIMLVGCIEYNDVLTMKPDGSGSFQMQIGIPTDVEMGVPGDSSMDFFQKDSLKARFSRIAGVHLDSIVIKNAEGMQLMVATLRFDSLGSLRRIGGENPEENFLGQVSLQKDGRNMIFERVLNPGPSTEGPEDQVDPMAVGVMNEMMGAVYWTYTVVLPGKILEANTSADRIDSAAGKVSWRILATEITGKSLPLKVRYQPAGSTVPWFAWVTIGIGLAVLFAALWSLFRKVRRLGQIIARHKASED